MSTSGSQAVGPLSATATYTLACTGSGGTTNQSVTVNVSASSGSGSGSSPTPPTAQESGTKGGGGAIDLWMLAALLAFGMRPVLKGARRSQGS